jgi:biotin carboxyl carrier protein
MKRYRITIGDKTFEVEILAVRGDQARVLVDGRPLEVKFAPAAGVAPPPRPAAGAVKPAPAPAAPPRPSAPQAPAPVAAMLAGEVGAVIAPMPGSILEVLVKAGDRVKAGDTVVKLEAMKMENDVKATRDGVVREVRVAKGSNVSVGEVLLVVAES